jgi:3-hydroxyisobutyrate dehydrogenase
MTMAERVGMVGVGLMGHSFAANLIAAGFEVQGFDTVAERLTALEALGGTVVDSPAAAARGVQWVVTSLPNSGIVR